MKYIRAKSKEDLIKKIKETEMDDNEVYINQELNRDVVIELLENWEIDKIYLPKSKYQRTSKKIINALKEIGVEVKSIDAKCGRPTNKDELIKKYMDKHPKEIAEITSIPLKTVEYHYYKLRKKNKKRK
ncbi:hypothetical protein [Methanotorris igneus]|uniref:Uncharacterized protein n=1 Tax=Methanotorris igneus (strain DSM 5666 / JCM 11834 / Kol 5) TaxID=880724 RepID=F6BB19_METIK|nr:hypothetical protein [Methanotorris igneus]AEF97106.1 hypothetical protein Metig_1572 [Methanotorris igneus Kol 5]